MVDIYRKKKNVEKGIRAVIPANKSKRRRHMTKDPNVKALGLTNEQIIYKLKSMTWKELKDLRNLYEEERRRRSDMYDRKKGRKKRIRIDIKTRSK